MNQSKLTIKNGRVLLPRGISEKWNNAEVAVLPSQSNDTLIIKRVQKPLRRLSEIAERSPLSRMNKQAINREIQDYRARR